MAEPSGTDYDASVIDVSPSGMKALSTTLTNLSNEVSDSLAAIRTQLDGLHLAWQGEAATDADEVSQDWLRVITDLFGTEEDPQKGVLPTLAGGVQMAAGNFAKADEGVAELFKKFRNDLTAPSGEGEDKEPKDTPPDAVTDTNKTAVTMTFPD